MGRAGTGSFCSSSFNFVLDRYLFKSLPENERVDLSGIAVCRVAGEVIKGRVVLLSGNELKVVWNEVRIELRKQVTDQLC